MKKKLLALVLVLVLTPTVVLAGVASEQITVQRNVATVTVNGEKINTDSFIYDGVTYVPLRVVSENLGSGVTWDNKTKTAAITSEETTTTTTTKAITATKDVKPSALGKIEGPVANVYWLGVLAQKNTEIIDIANATAWGMTYAESTAEFDDVYKGINDTYNALLTMKQSYYPSEIYDLWAQTFENAATMKALMDTNYKYKITAKSQLANNAINNCSDIIDKCGNTAKDLSDASGLYYVEYMGL